MLDLGDVLVVGRDANAGIVGVIPETIGFECCSWLRERERSAFMLTCWSGFAVVGRPFGFAPATRSPAVMLLVVAVLDVGGPPCATRRAGGRGCAFVCPRNRKPGAVVVISILRERGDVENG